MKMTVVIEFESEDMVYSGTWFERAVAAAIEKCTSLREYDVTHLEAIPGSCIAAFGKDGL